MHREKDALFRLYAFALDAVVLAATFWLVIWARAWLGAHYSFDLFPGPQPILQVVGKGQHFKLVILVLPTWLLFLRRYNTYDDLRRIRPDVLFLRILQASGVALLVLLALLFVLRIEDMSRTVLAGFAAAVSVTLFAARLAVRRLVKLFFGNVGTVRILLVGSPDEVRPMLDTLAHHSDWGLRVVGVIRTDLDEISKVDGYPIMGTLDDLGHVLTNHAIDQVFMTGRAWDTKTLRFVADSCEEVGVRFSMDANFLGLCTARADLHDFEGWSVLTFSSTPTNAEALIVKRAMDIALSGLALAVLSPVLLVTAAAIYLEDPGPVLFGQERSGLYGRTFTMWKFRSMVKDAEARKHELLAQNEMSGPVFKMKNDPRITRVGNFIRKTSVDEFPQFWNVFRGDMSLVGPRPPIPAEVKKYERWQMRRLSMKPGITCIWQVSGRNNIDFETWMKLDLQYIDNWSLFLDLKLLLKTLPVVLLGTGAR